MQYNRELIVIKDRPLVAENTGLVRILLIHDLEKNQFQEPSKSEFETSGVWISKGYDKIHREYDEGQPFALTQWNRTDKDPDKSVSDPNYQDHWALGSDAKALESGTLIPIVNGPLPDKSDGSFKYTND